MWQEPIVHVGLCGCRGESGVDCKSREMPLKGFQYGNTIHPQLRKKFPGEGTRLAWAEN